MSEFTPVVLAIVSYITLYIRPALLLFAVCHDRWAGTVAGMIASVQIQILSFVYSRVVCRLNNFENYQTETAYEDNLIFKTFLFQARRSN